MNRSRAEKKVTALLRRVMRESTREIQPERPLGGDGLGLDSLAIVEFVVAFENEFGIEVPESIWENMPAITPAYFTHLLTSVGS